MKRLNKKGFTLVELLAVIVILAIVVGITLVTVLPTLKESRQQAFDVTAQTAADAIEKEYQLSLIGQNKTITNFGSSASPITFGRATGDATFNGVGLKATNYTSGTYYVNTDTGRACVILNASSTGEYNNIDNATAKSSACPAS